MASSAEAKAAARLDAIAERLLFGHGNYADIRDLREVASSLRHSLVTPRTGVGTPLRPFRRKRRLLGRPRRSLTYTQFSDGRGVLSCEWDVRPEEMEKLRQAWTHWIESDKRFIVVPGHFEAVRLEWTPPDRIEVVG